MFEPVLLCQAGRDSPGLLLSVCSFQNQATNDLLLSLCAVNWERKAWLKDVI